MSDAATTTAPGRPITGRFVLICLIVFFGLIIAINVVMMKLAIETLPGTDVDESGGFPPALLIITLFVIGVFGMVVSFIRRR